MSRMIGDDLTPARGVYHPQDLRRMVESIRAETRICHISAAPLPVREEVVEVVARLRWLMFPGFTGPRQIDDAGLDAHVRRVMDDLSERMIGQVAAALRYQRNLTPASSDFQQHRAECESKAKEIVIAFFKTLPNVRRLLSLDVQASFDDDPAVHHTDEIIFSYPGLFALSVHRLAHELFKMNVPILPRMMSEHAHSMTGIDIHPGASIGQSFFIDHGTGVVIGETARIGDHCTIYQGVTLGAKAFPKDEHGHIIRGAKRHPTLEDHVTIYAGATVLGGDTVIRANCVINGGVLVAQSIPPGHIVRGPKIDVTLRSNPKTAPGNWAI
jgi:serine O-acetyltransferase